MRLLLLALVLMSGGCATGYHPSGLSGGFSEMRVNERAWRVSFAGNGYTSPERAAAMALRRAAELTAWSGYYGFWIADEHSYSKDSSWRTADQCQTNATVTGYGNMASVSGNTTCTPGQEFHVSKPRASMTISMVTWEQAQNAPAGVMVYDARMLLAQPPQ